MSHYFDLKNYFKRVLCEHDVFMRLIILFLSCIPVIAQSSRVIAHRGYWRSGGVTENSLASLVAAQKLGIYGSEFDVWLTADGVAVIHHDATINGKKIEETPYSEIRDYQLSNGEILPTLAAYLIVGSQNQDTRLIMELKPHTDKKREDALVKEALRLVELYNVANHTEYISFSKNICQQLHALAPDVQISYLNGDMTPAQVKEQGWTGIDYNESVFRKNPEWVAEARNLGLTTNVWTVNKEESMTWSISLNIDFITTDEPEILLNLIKSAIL